MPSNLAKEGVEMEATYVRGVDDVLAAPAEALEARLRQRLVVNAAAMHPPGFDFVPGGPKTMGNRRPLLQPSSIDNDRGQQDTNADTEDDAPEKTDKQDACVHADSGNIKTAGSTKRPTQE
jgi:hypothetical protein